MSSGDVWTLLTCCSETIVLVDEISEETRWNWERRVCQYRTVLSVLQPGLSRDDSDPNDVSCSAHSWAALAECIALKCWSRKNPH